MADYKRMVSYLYQYEDGVKRKNVGYARVEAKSGQCKITLHMQLLGQLDSIFPIYLIQREDENMELIYLGDAILKGQVMDSKFTADENNIMDSGFGLPDMGGLLLFLNENIFFATEWDDKPITVKAVLGGMRPKKQTTTKAEEVDKMPTAEVLAIKKREIVPDVITETEKSNITKEIMEAISPEGFSLAEELRMPKYKLPRGWKTLERLQQTVVEVSKQENNIEVENEVSPDQPEHPTAQHFFDHFPRIYPFEDNEILLCVKIEPKDIGMLPKETWALSNNSFLMHGFYSYHHLIFAKRKDRYGCHYILGIPGIYHNRERFMARMFGFEEFKSIRKRELKQGDFGYWYLTVNF